MELHKEVFLGLGSNIGERSIFIFNAICSLEAHDSIQVIKRSAVIETKPMGSIEQDDYLNQVIEIETSLSPHALLKVCSDIEIQNDRQRDQKWGPRTLDIDILFFGAKVVWEPDLMIPHPEVHKRVFMLEPLLEIAPEYNHPVFHQTIKAIHHSI